MSDNKLGLKFTRDEIILLIRIANGDAGNFSVEERILAANTANVMLNFNNTM